MYLVFSHTLKSFDMEDLETLWKLIKAKYGSTRPVEDLDLILWGDLKIMFKPHVEDRVWKNQQDYRVLDWKLYDSCGVHSLRMQHMHIHMLVEKRYPLTPATITDMLNKKLQLIIKQRVKANQKARILELKRRNHEEHCSDNLYVKMDDLDITIEEYVQPETERALKNDYEKYKIIYDNDLFSYKIFHVNDLKFGKDNDDDKIDIKQSLGDISIELLRDGISIDIVIIEQRVKVNQKACILELNEEIMKSNVLTTYTPYPSRKIQHIRALNFTQHPQRKDIYAVSR
ncbi:hypothetical protein Tco_0808662 [Tanacetum coccineum]